MPLASQRFDNLLAQANQVSRARLLAAADRDSGCWLNVVPIPVLGTYLKPEELRIAISLRVGAQVCQPHTCKCRRPVDTLGHHLLSCRFNEGRHPRHAALNDTVCRALKTAGLPSILEPVGLDRGDGWRPDGLTVFPFKRGLSLCWNATCVNTFGESVINRSAVSAGTAASEAERAKKAKYPLLCQRFQFEPIAFETAGTFGPGTRIILNEIGARLRERTGDKREGMWLKQRLAISVQRGNALTIISSAKHFTELTD